MLMERNMMEIGMMAWRMEKEYAIILMEANMMEIGMMTWRMEKE
jgi:hypothetical protein